MATTKSDEESEPKQKPIIVRNTTDLQRLKLEKLMKNPVSYLNCTLFIVYNIMFSSHLRTSLC